MEGHVWKSSYKWELLTWTVSAFKTVHNNMELHITGY
jgi:hypothetical protein